MTALQIKSLCSFTSCLQLLEEYAPDYIASLSDEEKDLLEGSDTWESLHYTVIDGQTVITSDDISGDVFLVETLEEFKNQTADWLREEMEE